MPLLNLIISKCSKRTLKIFFVIIISAFSFYCTIFDRFDLNWGYSLIWISLLYLLGAIIKKCDIGKNLKTWQALLGIFILSVVTMLYKMFGPELTIHGIEITKNLFISYLSPTVLISAILYVVAFSKIQFSTPIQKAITYSAPAAFSIYIINNHPLIWNNIMAGLFSGFLTSSSLTIAISTIGFSSLFVLTVIFTDNIRIWLFTRLNMKQKSIIIEQKARHLVDLLVSKLL